MSTKRRELRIKLQEILDKGGVFSTSQTLADDLADCAIELLETPKPRKPVKPNSGIGFFHLAAAIANVCKMDLEANKGMLMHEAKLLSKATPTPTPQLILEHYGKDGTWYEENYFGKQGETPRPAQIRQTWLRYAGGQDDDELVVAL
jgi:hypothetical protein